MGRLPNETALAQAAEKVGWAQIDMDEEGVLLPAGVTIDLGAIAKGYITALPILCGSGAWRAVV